MLESASYMVIWGNQTGRFHIQYFLEDNTNNLVIYLPFIKTFDNYIGGGTGCNLSFFYHWAYYIVGTVKMYYSQKVRMDY